jgi:hypothetical protein
MNKLQAMEQLRKALQMFAATLDDDKAMEVAYVYDYWNTNRPYKTGEILIYGENGVGDPQLYKVVQDHTPQMDWIPPATPALYTPIGLDPKGYPVWSQPTGAHDAYNIGDIVDYNGVLYQSTIDGNIWAPDAYPAGWVVYSEEG